MEIKSFIENFAEQLDETTIEMLAPDTKFRELGDWSSIVALGIIAMIDEEYNITLTGNEMKAASTIQELFEIVKNKK